MVKVSAHEDWPPGRGAAVERSRIGARTGWKVDRSRSVERKMSYDRLMSYKLKPRQVLVAVRQMVMCVA